MVEELHPWTRVVQYSTDIFTFGMATFHGQQKIPYQVTSLRPDQVRRYDRAERILLGGHLLLAQPLHEPPTNRALG